MVSMSALILPLKYTVASLMLLCCCRHSDAIYQCLHVDERGNGAPSMGWIISEPHGFSGSCRDLPAVAGRLFVRHTWSAGSHNGSSRFCSWVVSKMQMRTRNACSKADTSRKTTALLASTYSRRSSTNGRGSEGALSHLSIASLAAHRHQPAAAAGDNCACNGYNLRVCHHKLCMGQAACDVYMHHIDVLLAAASDLASSQAR